MSALFGGPTVDHCGGADEHAVHHSMTLIVTVLEPEAALLQVFMVAPAMHVCDGVSVRRVAVSRGEPMWNVDMPRRPVTCTFQDMKSKLGPLEESCACHTRRTPPYLFRVVDNLLI